MDDATATALENLAGKTGRPADEWLDIARALVPLGHGRPSPGSSPSTASGMAMRIP